MQRSTRMSFASRTAAALGFGLLFMAAIGNAETLIVQPEQLSLSAAQPVTKLHFNNASAEEMTLDFDVVSWQQDDEREWLAPSRKLIVIPERLTLKPGESGNIKIGLRLSGTWWEEEAFRLMVTQKSRIPDLDAENTLSSEGRISRPSSVPVFLLPPGKADPRISWRFERNLDGGVTLSARNSGKGHVQFNSASLLGPAGEAIQKPRMTDIILPGGSRSWEFSSDVAAGFWHLIADTSAGPMRARLELELDESAARALSYRE